MVVTIAVNSKMLARIANREDSDQTASLLPRLIQEGLLSVTSESMCTEYWLTA